MYIATRNARIHARRLGVRGNIRKYAALYGHSTTHRPPPPPHPKGMENHSPEIENEFPCISHRHGNEGTAHAHCQATTTAVRY